MSERKTIHCDFCGAVKGTMNHWFSLFVGENTHAKTKQLAISSFENREETCGNTYLDIIEGADACGSECTQKGVARFLASGTLEDVKEARAAQ